MPFSDLGLSEPILKAVADAGYSEPTPIQAQAIPVVLQGRDVLGCAQTGTGKTASFTLPMIELLSKGRAKARMSRSLILEPTRELAAQVAENFEVYGKHHRRMSMALLIGGVSFDEQAKVIDRGADVLIATPGRLLDMFERGGLLLRGVEILVIDEADRMLDMGFIPDVERIISLCNPKRQTLLFSATMPPEIRRLADHFLTEPEEISVSAPASTATTVEQTVSIIAADDKREALRQLLRSEPVKNALVFCNRKRDVDIVAKSLSKHGFNAAALHGDMTQTHRMQTLERFKSNDITILVCSDVAARGIDIQGLSHVFLFDVPIHAEDYVHRIGRTGRAGMEGRAFTLATPAEGKALTAVEKLIGREIPRFVIEGLQQKDLEPDDGRRGGRGRGRGKSDRTKSAKASEKPEKPERSRKAAAEDAPEAVETPAAAEPAEKPKRAPRSRASEATKAAPKTRSRTPRDRDRDDDKPVVGLGDHVPAFLLRPAIRRDARQQTDENDEG